MATPVRSVSSSVVTIGFPTKQSEYNNLRADTLLALTEFDRGTTVNLPASPTVGQRYLDTDANILYVSFDGATWSGIASSNVVVTATALKLSGNANLMLSTGSNIALFPSQKIYLSNLSGITHISEGATNRMDLTAGGSISMQLWSSGVAIQPTDKFWLDGGVHTYITESVDDTISFAPGGTERVTFSGSAATFISTGIEITGVVGGQSEFIISISGNTNILMSSAAGGSPTLLRLSSVDTGAAGEGQTVEIGRNTRAGSTAAGNLLIYDRGATGYYLWPDDSGNWRIGTTAPASVSDTSGTVVGTQTSWHELKRDISPWSGDGGLAAIRALPLHSFRFRDDGQRGDKLMHGLVVHEQDRGAWWAMNTNDNQTPVLDEAYLFGNLIGAVQEMAARIERLERHNADKA